MTKAVCEIVVDLNTSSLISRCIHLSELSMAQRRWGLVVREGKLLVSGKQDPIVGAQASKSQPDSIKVFIF